MVTELLGKAKRETDKQRARDHPRLARVSVKLAAAVRELLDASSSGRPVDFGDVWRQIERVVPRWELRAALKTVEELVPFADEDDEGEIRKRLAKRIRLVSALLRELTEVIEFGATPEGAPVLREMQRLPDLMSRRELKAEDINDGLVRGSWRRLVHGRPAPADGTVDRN
ncbi:MAG: Tn3 family transposase, partial [Actinobacteria bacterium]|nr:Tn3 family transposase [Actinomycetota bacterium]